MTDPIYDRKQHILEQSHKNLDSSLPSALRRQKILCSQYADSLPDSELLSHKRELRMRKLFSFMSIFALPAGLYFMRYSNHAIAYSFIPSIMYSCSVYRCTFWNTQTNYSYGFAEKSENRFLEKILKHNDRRKGTIDDMFSSVNRKEFLIKNEYS
jgi:hypothetical protein